MPRRTLLALAVAALSASGARAANPFPAPPESYVYNENVLSPQAAQELGLRLRAVEESTGHQFVVALFQSLEGENPEDYANRLFKAWRIGSKKNDDGLLFCLFLRERRSRVEVGYGLEPVITDLEAAEIAREQGSPHFQAGDFDGGVLAVVEGLTAKLEGTAGPRGPNLIWFKLLARLFLGFFPLFWITYERGFTWGLRLDSRRRLEQYAARYPKRALWIFGLYLAFLADMLLRMLANSGRYGGVWSEGGGGSWDGGGFSGGGGSSGGGGASGSW